MSAPSPVHSDSFRDSNQVQAEEDVNYVDWASAQTPENKDPVYEDLLNEDPVDRAERVYEEVQKARKPPKLEEDERLRFETDLNKPTGLARAMAAMTSSCEELPTSSRKLITRIGESLIHSVKVPAPTTHFDQLTKQIDATTKEIDDAYAKYGGVDMISESTTITIDLIGIYSDVISDLLRKRIEEQTATVFWDLIQPKLENFRNTHVEGRQPPPDRETFVGQTDEGQRAHSLQNNQENWEKWKAQFVVIANAIIEEFRKDFQSKLTATPTINWEALQKILKEEGQEKQTLFEQILGSQGPLSESIDQLEKDKKDLLAQRRGASICQSSTRTSQSSKWIACAQGNLSYLREQLKQKSWWEKKAYINETDENENTLIHIASSRPPEDKTFPTPQARDDLVVWLIKNGAVCDQRNRDGDTPLHLAVRSGHLLAAQTLLKGGADINAPGAGERTPLHEAVIHQNQLMVSLLTRAKTLDVKTKDSAQHSPFYYAIAGGVHEIAGLISLHSSWLKLSSDDLEDAESIPNLLQLEACCGDGATAQLLRTLLKNL